jgi:hypothetical protein
MIEIIQATVWPITVLSVCFYFRVQIKRGLERLTELGPSGVKFAPPPEQLQSPKPTTEPLGIPDIGPGSSPQAGPPKEDSKSPAPRWTAPTKKRWRPHAEISGPPSEIGSCELQQCAFG